MQFSFAQELDPVSWYAEIVSEKENHTLVFTAQIESGWYLYSQHIEEGGPIPTTFMLTLASNQLEAISAEEESEFQIKKLDEMFQIELTKYKNKVKFIYPLDESVVAGTIYAQVEFMCCDEAQCLAPRIEKFTLNLK